MAEAETNWIDFLISLAPVAQTGIWAGVAFVALLKLQNPLRELAAELVRRVNQGDELTTPWLSIGGKKERERKVVAQVTDNVRRELNSDPQLANSDVLISSKLDLVLNKVGNSFIDIVFPAAQFQTRYSRDAKVSLYFTEWRTVSDFLDDVYLSAIEQKIEIPVYTYGKYWVLENARTGKTLEKESLGYAHDVRPFDGLGLRPGDELVARRIV